MLGWSQRKLAAEQAQAQASAQQTEGSGANSAQRNLPGFNPAVSLQNGQVHVCPHRCSCSSAVQSVVAWHFHALYVTVTWHEPIRDGGMRTQGQPRPQYSPSQHTCAPTRRLYPDADGRPMLQLPQMLAAQPSGQLPAGAPGAAPPGAGAAPAAAGSGAAPAVPLPPTAGLPQVLQVLRARRAAFIQAPQSPQ